MATTVFGLATYVFKFLFGPAAGRWMDRTERMRVVRTGIALQAVGVCAALGVLGLLILERSVPATLLVLMVLCGILESLGALISSVAVKKDWVVPESDDD